MKHSAYHIRPIQASDNSAIQAVIQTVMPEFGAIGPGFSITDPEVSQMFENYQSAHARYFVAIAADSGQVIGGAGIGPLVGASEEYAELKKMYVLAEHRQRQLGYQLMQHCLNFAIAAQYQFIYLETLKTMERAQSLYESFGFQQLAEALGSTGHHGCDRYYLLKLDANIV
ncbi:MAG: GNAT family N-acetyltransferase [Oligoflexus sp.]